MTDPMTDPMTNGAILATLTGILRDLLGDPGIVLTPATTRPEVPRWDSFAYVSFIVAVEVEYGIRFPIADVESFQTVGDIVTAIRKLEGRVDAVQFVRVHPGLPAGHRAGLPPARAELALAGPRLADPRLGGLLRLVAAAEPRDHRPLDRAQLRCSAGCCSGSPAIRPAPAAAPSCWRSASSSTSASSATSSTRTSRSRWSTTSAAQDFVFKQVILPLGISFITFQKIAFLIDVAGGRIKAFTLRDYLLVRDVLPAADRRADHPLRRDHPAVRARHLPLRPDALRGRHHAVLLRAVQEGGARRRHGRARHPGLRLCRLRRRGDAAAVVAGGGRLHPADLLRLLGLFRHGLRGGAALRRCGCRSTSTRR